MMKGLLSNLKKDYYLQLGDKYFSPIMQFSIGLVMKYRDQIVAKKIKHPFHLNFPDKQQSALWLSVSLMRNFLLEDYINQPLSRIDELEIEDGDNIEIYGTTARLVKYYNDNIKLKFKDQEFTLKNITKLQMHINKTEKKRINKFSLYNKNRKKIKQNRNVISKLLEPKQPIIVNPAILTSQILVIAGRGNTGLFTQRLKEEKIFDKPLAKVFGCGTNIIIKPDLEGYLFLTKQEDQLAIRKFRTRFLKHKDELSNTLPNLNRQVSELIDYVSTNNFCNKNFITLFDEILDHLGTNTKFHRLKETHPGITPRLPDNLKSVIINDIGLLEVYTSVVEAFLERDIPVVVISNRYFDSGRNLSFFRNYFESHSDDLRLSWNKGKIKAISSLAENNRKLLDRKLWWKCQNFSKQNIEIITSSAHAVDKLILKVQRSVSNLEGHERLRNAYWKFFNPLVYSFKNSEGWAPYHEELLENFLTVYNEIKVVLADELCMIFEEIFRELKNNSSNKTFEDDSKVFSQQIELEVRSEIFPKGNFENVTNDKIDISISEITFPGFPLNEPINNYLIKTISEDIIKKTIIVCWPKEGELTYHYIKNRLEAGYFTDKIPENWNFPEDLLLNIDSDIQDEINDSLLIASANENEFIDNITEQEDVLTKISSFKYSPYQNSNGNEENYVVTCNIIDFAGSKFMFLPKNSSVLAKVETNESDFIFKRAKFNDLKIGDQVFEYDLPRRVLRGIAKKVDGSDIIFSELEIWKESLIETYQSHHNDINLVIENLDTINRKFSFGGSPSYQNIRNWLFDNNMHAPSENNLKMILGADQDKNKIHKVPDIVKAAKAAKSLSQKISSQIKNAITLKLNNNSRADSDEIIIEIQGSSIKVRFSRIVHLQKAEIEIEYQNTRKIVG